MVLPSAKAVTDSEKIRLVRSLLRLASGTADALWIYYGSQNLG